MSYDALFKMAMTGPAKGGKSSLLSRLTDDKFSKEYQPTIGVEFGTRIVTHENQQIKLQIWDTAGSEQYAAITNSYFKGSSIIWFVFDISDKESFVKAQQKASEIHNKGLIDQGTVAVLVGTKKDLEGMRQVQFEEAQSYGESIGIYIETSALTAENIDKLANESVKLKHKTNLGGEPGLLSRITTLSGANPQNSTIQEKKQSFALKNLPIPLQKTESQSQAVKQNYGASPEITAPGNDPASELQKTAANEQQSIMIKVLFVGDEKVGKTSIMRHFACGKFTETYLPTIGVEFMMKKVNCNNQSYRLQMWDTAGQQRFRCLTSSYYKSSNIVLLTYSIESKKSFEACKTFMKEIRNVAEPDLFVIVGNKNDSLERQVSSEEAMEFAANEQIDFVEISAKNLEEIEKVFSKSVEIYDQIYQKKKSGM